MKKIATDYWVAIGLLSILIGASFDLHSRPQNRLPNFLLPKLFVLRMRQASRAPPMTEHPIR
jgi:hypothetical protein